MKNSKQTRGIDVCMYKDFTNFGIIRVSEQVRSDIVSHEESLEALLLSSVQSKEVMVGDVESNKYPTPKSPSISATIIVHKIDSEIGNIVHERTLIMEKSIPGGDRNKVSKDKVFVIAFEDIPENYESGKSQKQLREIFESFRFI